MYYPIQIRMDIFTVFVKNNRNVKAAHREYRRLYPDRAVPDKNTFRNVWNKMANCGSLANRKKLKNINEDRELQVLLYFQEDRKRSIRDASRDIGISYTTIQRILHKHKYTARKPRLLQKLFPNDTNIRTEFCQTILERYRHNREIFRCIFWTDEASFTTAGICNRKNNHYWAAENLHVVEETQFQGRRSLNVWAGIIHNQVIYAFFDGHMNGVKYLQILREKVENYLEHIPLNEVLDIIWQQDGAPCHNTLQVTNYLNQHFDEWIGRNGPIRWPPRSPDLTPLDFFCGAI